MQFVFYPSAYSILIVIIDCDHGYMIISVILDFLIFDFIANINVNVDVNVDVDVD